MRTPIESGLKQMGFQGLVGRRGLSLGYQKNNKSPELGLETLVLDLAREPNLSGPQLSVSKKWKK